MYAFSWGELYKSVTDSGPESECVCVCH